MGAGSLSRNDLWSPPSGRPATDLSRVRGKQLFVSRINSKLQRDFKIRHFRNKVIRSRNLDITAV